MTDIILIRKINYFLTGSSLNLVINYHSLETLVVNADVPHGSLLGTTLFLIYINYLPKNILKLFVNIR